MTYRNYYTYGIKTTSEINALTNLKEGESVWNSDLSKPEYVVNNGGTLLWVNEDCIVCINNQGSAVSEGDLVRIDNSVALPGAYVRLQTDPGLGTPANRYLQTGVVFRGGNNGSKIVVAQQGLYKVKYRNIGVGTVATRGNIVIYSITAGQVVQIASTSTGSGTYGAIGIVMQQLTNAQVIANNYLVKIMIQNLTAN
jgi:hypothetical protein